MRDPGLHTLSAFGAVIVNSLIFASMAWAGMTDDAEQKNPEPPIIAVTLAALPKKGIERKPDALPRIIKAAEAPEPEADAINLARKKAEQEEQVKKKKLEAKRKRELAEEKRRLDENERKLAQKRKAKKARKERRDRKRRMAIAMGHIDDRGDEDTPEGFKDGYDIGTNNTLNVAQDAYVSLVSTVLQRQFEVPAVVPADERKRLVAHVHLRLNKRGEVVGEPKLIKRSKNRFFNQAALAAAKRFTKGSTLRIPLPPKSNKPLYRLVLKEGITAKMTAR